MTDQNDLELFNRIASGETSEETTTPVETETPKQEQARDEAGKFAKAEVPTETPPEAEIPTQSAEERNVPLDAIQGERRRRQDAERRAEELERRIATLEARAPAAPATPKEPETPVDLFSDPDLYLKNQLTPLEKRLQKMQEDQWEWQATQVHGADKIAAANEAAKAYHNTPQGYALYQEIMAGGNPISNLVKWHERQQMLTTVGNDPQAWLEKQLADPAIQARVLEMTKANAAATVGNGRTNNAPVTSLPPSLSRIPASGNGNAAPEPQSDADLFNSITSRRR